MKNFLYFVLILAFVSIFSFFFNNSAFAGGAGGSWGCPDGYTTKPDGSCSFDGGGGGTGGSGGGGSWSSDTCAAGSGGYSFSYYEYRSPKYSTLDAACKARIEIGGNVYGYSSPPNRCYSAAGGLATVSGSPCSKPEETKQCASNEKYNPVTKQCEFIPPPPFPDLPPPNPDCNVCQSLYEIKQKLNVIKNQDLAYINQNIYNMTQTVNNIDNSITSLNVEMNTVNNNLTTINNNMGDLITNIENNNITNNEIKNIVNNIDNSMTEYALKLGDIELALGDIELSLDNTNKLVLGLKPDIEFIKNNLVNGSPEGKDYTEQLNEIIELLKPCVPTAEQPCPDDDAIVRKLKDIEDFMKADFEPDTDSTAVEVEDLTNIELDRDLIKFGVAQCPPDNEFSTMVNGFSFSGGFKHKPLCDFFTLLSPFIKAFGGFSAALILGGGLRRG